MLKNCLLISIVPIILSLVFLTYYMNGHKQVDINRVQSGDRLKLLIGKTKVMLEFLHSVKGYKNLAEGQQKRADDKISGCMLRTLMLLPEISDEGFQYLPLKQKDMVLHDAMLKHQQELEESFGICFGELPRDIKDTIEKGGI